MRSYTLGRLVALSFRSPLATWLVACTSKGLLFIIKTLAWNLLPPPHPTYYFHLVTLQRTKHWSVVTDI